MSSLLGGVCAGWLALGALAANAQAEASLRVRVHVPSERIDSSAAELVARGFDVVPGSGADGSLEVIVSRQEADALLAGGYSFDVVARGVPAAASETSAAYPSLDEIVARLRRTASLAPPIARLVDLSEEIGAPRTFEDRPIYALRISDNVAYEENEPAVLILAGLHARELVNPLIALDVADRLVAGYGIDAQITDIVDHNDIWIAPVWNPDGYEHVFAQDNLWRKNRQPYEGGVGVDLNRNFPYGWDSACAGATSVTSRFYKGPSPASESETRAMLALTDAIWFARVLELHSPGREVLWGSPCSEFPFGSFIHEAAIELSRASGYGGRTRRPSADGEQHQWQLARTGTFSFLVETQTDWQPPYEAALAEAERVWPGVLWLLSRPISVSGRVTDACTGAAMASSIEIADDTGEPAQQLHSGGRAQRFHAVLRPGPYRLTITTPGYRAETRWLEVTPDSAVELDLALSPAPPLSCESVWALPEGVEPEAEPWGCGCRGATGPSAAPLALLLVIALTALRSRRA